MDKQSITVVILVLVSFFLAILLAARFNDETSASAPAAVQPVKKFRAKPGTERENARALVSDLPSAATGNTTATTTASAKPREVWGRLDNPQSPTETTNESPVDAPEDSPDRVESPAEWPADIADADEVPAHALELHTYAESPAAAARGVTVHSDYTLLTPNLAAETETAARAYDRALAAATTHDQRLQASYLYANTLVQRGDPAAALDLIRRQTANDDATSPQYLQLRALESVCLQQTGNDKEAAAVLHALLDHIEDQPHSPQLTAIYRQAALRLTRLHQHAGDTTAARRLQRRLEAFELI